MAAAANVTGMGANILMGPGPAFAVVGTFMDGTVGDALPKLLVPAMGGGVGDWAGEGVFDETWKLLPFPLLFPFPFPFPLLPLDDLDIDSSAESPINGLDAAVSLFICFAELGRLVPVLLNFGCSFEVNAGCTLIVEFNRTSFAELAPMALAAEVDPLIRPAEAGLGRVFELLAEVSPAGCEPYDPVAHLLDKKSGGGAEINIAAIKPLYAPPCCSFIH
jgi:hypothetical protein